MRGVRSRRRIFAGSSLQSGCTGLCLRSSSVSSTPPLKGVWRSSVRRLMGVMCKWAYGNGCSICREEYCSAALGMGGSGLSRQDSCGKGGYPKLYGISTV